MNVVNSHLADYLKTLRGKKSLYQIEKDIGFSRSLLRRYELGERVPEDATLQKLAEYYGVPFGELKMKHFEDLYPEHSVNRQLLRDWLALL